MIDNLLKIIKSKKFLDIFCNVFFIIYIFFSISFIIVDYTNNKNISLKFENMLAYTREFNKKIEEEKIINQNNNEQNFNTEQIFFNGKDAILSAYSSLYNANSYYMGGAGKFSIVVSVATVQVEIKVDMNVEYAKFNSDKVYENGGNRLSSVSVPSFYDMVKKEVNKSHKILREGTHYYAYETDKFDENGEPDYSKNIKDLTKPISVLPDNLFIINEETIKDITYFKTKQTKQGLNYYVQLAIDCEKALEKFSVYMQESANALEPAKFTNFVITACIDSNGIPISINILASCILKMDIMGGIDANTNINLTLAISGINEEINLPIDL